MKKKNRFQTDFIIDFTSNRSCDTRICPYTVPAVDLRDDILHGQRIPGLEYPGRADGPDFLGHASFMGLGAYMSTLLLVKLNVSPWISIPLVFSLWER